MMVSLITQQELQQLYTGYWMAQIIEVTAPTCIGQHGS